MFVCSSKLFPWTSTRQYNRVKLSPWTSTRQYNRVKLTPWTSTRQYQRVKLLPWTSTRQYQRVKLSLWKCIRQYNRVKLTDHWHNSFGLISLQITTNSWVQVYNFDTTDVLLQRRYEYDTALTI